MKRGFMISAVIRTQWMLLTLFPMKRLIITAAVMLLSAGCGEQPDTMPGNITRLYPVEGHLPLIQLNGQTLNDIRKTLNNARKTLNNPSQTMEKSGKAQDNPGKTVADVETGGFYRLEINGVSRPGRLLYENNQWITKKRVMMPDRLRFSTAAVGRQQGPMQLRVSIRDRHGTSIRKTYQIDPGNPGTVGWQEHAMDIKTLTDGPMTVGFELISGNELPGGNGWIGIGTPCFMTRMRQRKKTHVVLFIADTLRADHLGCYGMPEQLTPEIDHLSRHATLCRSAVAASSWTKPSVNAMFTGVYPYRNKVLGAPYSQYRTDIKTLTESLAENGYYTLGVSSNLLIVPMGEYDRGFDLFNSRLVLDATTNSTRGMFKTLTEMLPENPCTPFFLFAHCMDPHDQYVPPPPFKNMFCPNMNHGKIRGTVRQGHSTQTANDIEDGLLPPLETDELMYLHARYTEEIRCVDAMVGDFIRTLRDRYPDDAFIFMFISDHGEEFMEHGGLSHGRTLFQESIHIPWLISRLDPCDPGIILNQRVSHVDLPDTLKQSLRISVSEQDDGRPIESRQSDAANYIWSFLGNLRSRKAFCRALFSDSIKIIKQQDMELVQYDLSNDPAEFSSMALAPDDPLRLKIMELITEESVSRGHHEMPPKMMAQLRQLGYVR